jgi:hypothetical protein
MTEGIQIFADYRQTYKAKHYINSLKHVNEVLRLYSLKYKTSLACPQNMYGELQRCPLLYFKGIGQIDD